MLRSIGIAFLIVAPFAVTATVLANVLEASRPLALGVLMAITGIGAILAAEIDRRHQDRQDGSGGSDPPGIRA